MNDKNKICPRCGSIMKKVSNSSHYTMVSSATDYRPDPITSGQRKVSEIWKCTNQLCRAIIWD